MEVRSSGDKVVTFNLTKVPRRYSMRTKELSGKPTNEGIRGYEDRLLGEKSSIHGAGSGISPVWDL